MRLLAVLLVATVIPALGLLVSLWIISDANSDLLKAGLPSYGILCSVLELSNDLDVRAACNEYSNIVLLRDASIVSAILGLGIPLLYWLSALFAGKNRRRLSTIFPPLVRISVVLLSVSVLLQGAIFTYAAYIGQVYAIERVFFILVGAIGLGALQRRVDIYWARGQDVRMWILVIAGLSVAPIFWGFLIGALPST